MGSNSPQHDRRSDDHDWSFPTASLPKIDRKAILRCPSHSTEIEAKFFTPPDVTKRVTKGLSFNLIEQRYFPRDMIPELLREFRVADMVPGVEDFSSARIRRARTPSGEVSYAIEFKGKKASFEGSRIFRREFGISLPHDVYSQLLPNATAGAIRKHRFEIEGYIKHHGENSPATAQVDVVTHAGVFLEKVKVDFCTVDIELPSVDFITSLRAGKHSWKFLDACLDITFNESDATRALSTRKVAKNGFDDERVKALKTLHRQLKNVNKRLEK